MDKFLCFSKSAKRHGKLRFPIQWPNLWPTEILLSTSSSPQTQPYINSGLFVYAQLKNSVILSAKNECSILFLKLTQKLKKLLKFGNNHFFIIYFKNDVSTNFQIGFS